MDKHGGFQTVLWNPRFPQVLFQGSPKHLIHKHFNSLKKTYIRHTMFKCFICQPLTHWRPLTHSFVLPDKLVFVKLPGPSFVRPLCALPVNVREEDTYTFIYILACRQSAHVQVYLGVSWKSRRSERPRVSSSPSLRSSSRWGPCVSWHHSIVGFCAPWMLRRFYLRSILHKEYELLLDLLVVQMWKQFPLLHLSVRLLEHLTRIHAETSGKLLENCYHLQKVRLCSWMFCIPRIRCALGWGTPHYNLYFQIYVY